MKPSNDTIDIWQIDLRHEALLKKTCLLLNTDELARANRFHFAKHTRRFSLARAAMRLLLMHYTELSPLSFEANKYGKPFIPNTDIKFNLSHSRDTALLAITQSFELGVDIEFFSNRDLLGIAKHAFSNQENRALSQLDSQQLDSAFFHIWAQKEAFIKACGMGLSYDTKAFTVTATPPANLLSTNNEQDNHWHLHSFQPFENCWAALCYQQHRPKIRYLHFDWDEWLL